MRSVWPVTFLILCLCLTIADAAKRLTMEDMTVEAIQTLIDEVGEDKAEKAKKVTALYRDDLPEDCIAYYEVVFGKNYYIIRAGEKTGGHELVTQGDRPEPSQIANDDAKSREARCVKYYLMTTGGDVMCADKNGQFVGTSVPASVVVADNMDDITRDADKSEEPKKEVDAAKIDDVIKTQSAERAKQFQENAEIAKVEDKEDNIEGGEDEESERSADDDFMDLMKRREQGADENTGEHIENEEYFVARAIIPGTVEKLATGNVADVAEIRVISGEEEAVAADHKKLCEVLRGCDPSTATDKYAKLKPDHIAEHKVTVDIELLQETEQKYNNTEFVFAVVIVSKQGQVITQHYGVMYEDETEKRGFYQYGKYSRWYYWDIPCRNLFPNYRRPWAGRCYAGYGAVAWASIFAYFDRRSHLDKNYWRSKRLYKSGRDGSYGSENQVAPSTPDTRLYNYIKCINYVIKSYCVGSVGKTKYSKMDYVRSFFWWRNYGSPKISEISGSKSFNWVRDQLYKRWPVITVWNNGSYNQFVVATRLARRWRWRRYCYTSSSCRGWYRQYDYLMYINVGWGNGRGNRWVRLNTPYAVVATY